MIRAVLLGFSALFVLAPLARADEPRYAAMIIDANTGEVLHDHAGDEPRRPASLTKMMTLYIVFDLIEQGRLSFDSKVKISAKAAAVAPSKLDLEPGEEIRLIDGVKALITKSANDVAVAIAEEISGTEANFAQLMTIRAHSIGMTATTFRNASGLPDDGQVTTARDMLTLALRLQDDFPEHYKLFSTREFTYAGETYRNHNTLLRTFRGADGVKTGYTRASGFNLVSSVKRGGKSLVGVVFGGQTASIRNANMRNLLANAFARASAEKTRKPTAVARMAPLPRPARRTAAVEARAKPAVGPTSAQPRPPAVKPARRPSPEVKLADAAGDSPASSVPIAKVKRVLVTPKVASATTNSTTEEAGTPGARVPAAFATASASAGPRLAAATEPRPPTQTAAWPEAAVRPSSPKAPAPQAKNPPPTPEKRVAAVAKPVARAADSSGPSPRDPASPAGPAGYQIQIGAYDSASEAERQLGAVRERTGDLLLSRKPVTQMVQKGARQLYRARFAGFDSAGAASTCAELKRQQIDCFVMRAE